MLSLGVSFLYKKGILMEKKYANIIIDIAHEKVDHPFTYRIPDALKESIFIGSPVLVPFGRGDTARLGYVIEIKNHADLSDDRLKEILTISKESVSAESKLIQMAIWMKNRYGSTLIQSLKTVLPVKSKITPVKKETVQLNVSVEEAASLQAEWERKHFTAKARVVEALIQNGTAPKLWMQKILNVPSATLKSLENQQIIRIETEQIYRDAFRQSCEEQYYSKTLTKQQQEIVQEILDNHEDGQCVHMLKGITGSGKTEIYMELIGHKICEGKQAIVLIPEIALTYQTVMRFRARFGDRVTVMHSKLSPGERFDQMEKAKHGEVDIMIGPRSALFTPFSNLGIIIIDEEHESSYKSENVPKYHAREAAKYLATSSNSLLVLGSATPSLETYYAYRKGEICGHFLDTRYLGSELPNVQIVDLREELKSGNKSIFSESLQQKIEERLERREQTMLFINRRGYAGFVSCRACGLVMKCPHCDVSLSEHHGNKLVCHYCGYETSKVKNCPSCHSTYISGFRAGTQQIVEKLEIMFPRARILRMDADTTKKKDSYENILSSFANGEADILVGTQMIVKGHDFPLVTLVGILAADLSLSVSDYRAGEKTFQLLTQAAGRAGRREKKGDVIIQTYQPDHYSIIHASNQDFESFYEEEIMYREMCTYPPAGHLMCVLLSSKSEKETIRICKLLAEKIKDRCISNKVILLGPSAAGVGKINDFYRWVFYLKSKDEEALMHIKNYVEELFEKEDSRYMSMQFDFDPIHVY